MTSSNLGVENVLQNSLCLIEVIVVTKLPTLKMVGSCRYNE